MDDRNQQCYHCLTASQTTAATPSFFQSWAKWRSWLAKRNCADELWSLESAGNEFSIYGTRAMFYSVNVHCDVSLCSHAQFGSSSEVIC